MNISFKNSGIATVIIIVILAKTFNQFINIGAIPFAIIIGMLVNNIFNIKSHAKKEISFMEKNFLNLAIVLMGAGFNLTLLKFINFKSFFLIFSIILFAIICAYVLGNFLKISNSLALLVGVGNGICGSSAIASISSVIKCKKEHIGLSITAINFLGTISIFLFPLFFEIVSKNINYNLQGLLIGSTVQALGQVTAAGYLIDEKVGEISVFIKMIRILFLGPILLVFAAFFSNKASNKTNSIIFQIPYFIFGFIFFIIISNLNILSQHILESIILMSKYLLLAAMVCTGLNLSFSTILEDGREVFTLATITYCLQLTFAYLLIYFLM